MFFFGLVFGFMYSKEKYYLFFIFVLKEKFYFYEFKIKEYVRIIFKVLKNANKFNIC